MHPPILRVHLKKKKDQQRTCNDAYAMYVCFFSSDFLCKSICYGYSFELHRQVDAIQLVPITYAIMKKQTKSTLAVI